MATCYFILFSLFSLFSFVFVVKNSQKVELHLSLLVFFDYTSPPMPPFLLIYLVLDGPCGVDVAAILFYTPTQSPHVGGSNGVEYSLSGHVL